MRALGYVSIVAVLVVGLAVSTTLAGPPPPNSGKAQALPGPVTGSNLATLPCMVSGQVKLNPADHTNGYLNYWGVINFKATAALEDVSLYLGSSTAGCVCASCPDGARSMPKSRFAAGEGGQYSAVCSSWPPTHFVSDPVGKGSIQFWVRTVPGTTAGKYTRAACSGAFSFVN
jgi:hypothetical protein